MKNRLLRILFIGLFLPTMAVAGTREDVLATLNDGPSTAGSEDTKSKKYSLTHVLNFPHLQAK